MMVTRWEIDVQRGLPIRGGLLHWAHFSVGDNGTAGFKHESDARATFDAIRSRGESVRLVKVTHEVTPLVKFTREVVDS